MLNIVKEIKFKKTSGVKNYIQIDGLKRMIKKQIDNLLEKITKSQIYDFNDLIYFKVIAEDGIAMRGKSQYYCNLMEIKVILKGCNRYIEIIEKPLKKNSRKYRKIYENAQEIIETLQFVKMVNEAM